MGDVVFQAFLSALNPTLVAVTTLMLLLPDPGRLMLGYWLGAMITSVAIGLLIVFSLQSSSTVSTTKTTLSPLADIVLGALARSSRSSSPMAASSAIPNAGRSATRTRNRQGGSVRCARAHPGPRS